MTDTLHPHNVCVCVLVCVCFSVCVCVSAASALEAASDLLLRRGSVTVMGIKRI